MIPLPGQSINVDVLRKEEDAQTPILSGNVVDIRFLEQDHIEETVIDGLSGDALAVQDILGRDIMLPNSGGGMTGGVFDRRTNIHYYPGGSPDAGKIYTMERDDIGLSVLSSYQLMDLSTGMPFNSQLGLVGDNILVWDRNNSDGTGVYNKNTGMKEGTIDAFYTKPPGYNPIYYARTENFEIVSNRVSRFIVRRLSDLGTYTDDTFEFVTGRGNQVVGLDVPEGSTTLNHINVIYSTVHSNNYRLSMLRLSDRNSVRLYNYAVWDNEHFVVVNRDTGTDLSVTNINLTRVGYERSRPRYVYSGDGDTRESRTDAVNQVVFEIQGNPPEEILRWDGDLIFSHVGTSFVVDSIQQENLEKHILYASLI